MALPRRALMAFRGWRRRGREKEQSATCLALALACSSVCSATSSRADDDASIVLRLVGISSLPADLLHRRKRLRIVRLLAEQTRGIDYASLGLGWDHPTTRIEYRMKEHPSFQDARSLQRSEKSRGELAALLKSGNVDDASLVRFFLREIGLSEEKAQAVDASTVAVYAALEAELLLPLRALIEAGPSLYHTFPGYPIPEAMIDDVVASVVLHVLRGDFSAWRYGNAMGLRQLEGLSAKQIAQWAEATRIDHPEVVTHEDAPSELGLFWATKIGGPSHGFDFEPQCLLPLLANARHKVVLVSDPKWPHNPAGRAHLRLLWTDTTPQKPVLFLESVNADFAAANSVPLDRECWIKAVVAHVMEKAATMQVAASFTPELFFLVDAFARGPFKGTVRVVSDSLVLRPSNAVTEASDYLSDKHDWVQMEEEHTQPLQRCVYEP